MITLLLAVAILGSDDGLEPLLADQPGDAYAVAYERFQRDHVPLVVLVSADWCTPCQQLKEALRPWALRRDLAFVVISNEHPAAAKIMSGRTVPQLVAWQKIGDPGKRIIGYRGESAAAIERSLLGLPPRTDAAGTPYLSVLGSSPGAQHEVTVRGAPAIVEPNTEHEWRRHVAEDHGIAAAWTMTPQQLAQAHADAHNATSRRRRR